MSVCFIFQMLEKLWFGKCVNVAIWQVCQVTEVTLFSNLKFSEYFGNELNGHAFRWESIIETKWGGNG